MANPNPAQILTASKSPRFPPPVRCDGASLAAGWPSPVVDGSLGPAPGCAPVPPPQGPHCPLGMQSPDESQALDNQASVKLILEFMCGGDHQRSHHLLRQTQEMKLAQRRNRSAKRLVLGREKEACCHKKPGHVLSSQSSGAIAPSEVCTVLQRTLSLEGCEAPRTSSFCSHLSGAPLQEPKLKSSSGTKLSNKNKAGYSLGTLTSRNY